MNEVYLGLMEMRQSTGFTLVELVVVILLLGILSAFAIPRFFNLDGYKTRAAYDEVVGAVRYAQKLAVASGCPAQVVLTASTYAIQQRKGGESGCPSGDYVDISTAHPVSTGNFSPVALTPAKTFTFDAIGRSSTGATIKVGNLSFSVFAETGYVDAP